MREPEPLMSDHIDPEILAAGADPLAPLLLDGAAQAHLVRCARCLSLVAEFGRAHLDHTLSSTVVVPPELIAAARAIPTRRLQVLPAPPRPWARWSPWAAALASAAVLAGLLLWGPGRTNRRAGVAGDLRRALTVRMCEDSFEGLLYAGDLVPRARGTRGAEPGSADPNLTPLFRAYGDEPPSAEVTYWLVAGLLASDRLGDADPYLRKALDRFPGDDRMHNLAAILAYKTSQLEIAESELEAALRIDREAAYLANLARVLEERGRTSEAEALWQEVLAEHPGSPAAGVATDHLRKRR